MRINFATKKTTNARTIKLMSAARKDPHPRTIGPIENFAFYQSPPETKGVITGITMLFTKDCTRVVAAEPIINATASPTILYSFRKLRNSEMISVIKKKRRRVI